MNAAKGPGCFMTGRQVSQIGPRWRGLAYAAAALAAGMLAGCTSSSFEQLPRSMGGLPEGVPPQSATPVAYPSVHEMPPKREEAVLTEAEKKRLREELAAQRDRRARDTTADINADTTGSTAAPARKP